MTCGHNDDRLIEVAVDLLAAAANAWASSATGAAERLCAAAWVIVGDAEFVDDDEVNR